MPKFDRVVRVIAVPKSGVSRQWAAVGQTAGLRIAFDVTQTTGKEPNTGKVEIYNLNRDSRAFVQRAQGIILEAGHAQSTVGTFFKGEISRAEVKRPGTGDVITEAFCADGLGAFANETISTSLGPGTSLREVFRVVSAATGVVVRFVDSAILEEALERSVENGITMHGPASLYLEYLARQLGATWSYIDGELVFYRNGGLLPDQAILVAPETGLVASPSELTKKRKSGRIEVIGLQWDILLEHRMRPGAHCVVRSADFEGPHIAQKVRHHGDSGYQRDFYSSVEATEVGRTPVAGAI